MQVVVIGAGVIGAAIACQLARGGAQVTLLDAAGVAAGASGRSFGWINASFHADADHFRLRAESMAAYRRLAGQIGLAPVAWPGCLCWEQAGDALDSQADALRDLGYDVAHVDRAQFARMEPNVTAPQAALHFTGEGVAETGALTHALITAACEAGTRMILGVAARGIETVSGTVSGVRTDHGVIPGDRIVVAGGTGSAALLASVDVALPMLRRPGLMLRSAPVAQVLNHILVAPEQEFRQDAAGRILAPTAASHQSDQSDAVIEPPDILADAAMARVQGMVTGVDLHWQQVTYAMRPVPQDGLPVIGRCGPGGLHVAVMHSGITLAPLVAEMVATQVLDGAMRNAQAALAAPYSPDRFQSAMS